MRNSEQFRGSRKHVLDWTGQPSFLDQLFQILKPIPLNIDSAARFMPQGVESPDEARLEIFGYEWLPNSDVWSNLQAWWLCHTAGANTPNWDIAVGCQIEDRPGLILVEAKANWPELNTNGKQVAKNASARSLENHARIGDAIEEANLDWQSIDPRVSITRDSHYQLANRLAFTWKLATFGIPVVLLYMGFTGDEGIRNVGAPFADPEDWQKAFHQYSVNTVPEDLFDRRLEIDQTPVWLISRSHPILESSPPPNR